MGQFTHPLLKWVCSCTWRQHHPTEKHRRKLRKLQQWFSARDAATFKKSRGEVSWLWNSWETLVLKTNGYIIKTSYKLIAWLHLEYCAQFLVTGSRSKYSRNRRGPEAGNRNGWQDGKTSVRTQIERLGLFSWDRRWIIRDTTRENYKIMNGIGEKINRMLSFPLSIIWEQGDIQLNCHITNANLIKDFNRRV